MKYLSVLIIFAFLVVGCSHQEPTQEVVVEKQLPRVESHEQLSVNEIVSKCQELCRGYTGELSNGPCLSNQLADDWVCDVAHSPRQAVDNIAENQCEWFRQGKAHHFVEVDENCNLIRYY